MTRCRRGVAGGGWFDAAHTVACPAAVSVCVAPTCAMAASAASVSAERGARAAVPGWRRGAPCLSAESLRARQSRRRPNFGTTVVSTGGHAVSFGGHHRCRKTLITAHQLWLVPGKASQLCSYASERGPRCSGKATLE